ncbi:exodeoxyribonuclease III [Sanguibacter antarcticus]|uniref:Exodeoxyribonuclease-3 n=1 Tax=Sanguibacter antarcticus TaxID=372484 RepID=A0A2A9E4U2_9MICO|nr:exodeoxyribonuclease III [Sanguibacter antarcticus]PFG33874.1 exodeoxyribonuclease-3 [Sanguibacter antarcticus]
MLTIASVNVNGVRAAYRHGMGGWLADRKPDILLLQEVRATDEILSGLLGEGWNSVHQACEIKGRAGVAVVTALPLDAVRIGLGKGEPEVPVDTGRWVEADVRLPSGEHVTVVSAYIHSGTAGTPKMDEKYAYLVKVTERLRELTDAGGHVVVAGDLNIAHTNDDIKNWKGNLKSAGFLPEERAYLDTWFDELGWADLGRRLAGPGPGPYTWWSNRGQAFDNDSGWRIDYQLGSRSMAEVASNARVDRAASYAERWSDHAPLLVDYDV